MEEGRGQSSVEAHWLRAAPGEPKVLQRASYLEYGVLSLRGRLQQSSPKAPKARFVRLVVVVVVLRECGGLANMI